MANLSSFEIVKAKDSFFQFESFFDTKHIKEYLRKSSDKSKAIPAFDQTINFVDKFSEMRSEAESLNKETNFYKVYNKRNEIPLSWDSINNILDPTLNIDKKEPPTRLINIIAKDKITVIQELSSQMRKILKREREMVPISRVQQLDSVCLRWLTIQPGYTTEQKAGIKQRVKSVIRIETYNTLENRVFKEFLHLCLFECQRYIKKYEKLFKNSERIKEVRKLQCLALYILLKPEMEGIKKIVNIPKPNYVLQNNKNYKVIWDLYKKLLKNTKIMELIWSKRQHIFLQYSVLSIVNFLKNYNSNPNIFTYYFEDPWIFFQPDKEKYFITNYLESEKLIYFKRKNLFLILKPIAEKKSLEMIIQHENRIIDSFKISFFFIPDIMEVQNFTTVQTKKYNQNNINEKEIFIIYIENTNVKINIKEENDEFKYILIHNEDDIYLTIKTGIKRILNKYLGDNYV